MAVIQTVVKLEVATFQGAVKRAETGDTICICSAPQNVVSYESIRPHMSFGVLSVAKIKSSIFPPFVQQVYFGPRFVCSRDHEGTYGDYYSFYELGLLYRHGVENGKTIHKFHLVDPEIGPHPEPAYSIEAKKLKIIQLMSGKGLILIADDKILLLKRDRFCCIPFRNKVSAKKIRLANNGSYETCIETPSSLVVGLKRSLPGEIPMIEFYRGHGGHRKRIYRHEGTTLPKQILATDDNFFIENDEGAIVSTITGKIMYPDASKQFYVTEKALVQQIGHTIWANGIEVKNDFNSEWVVPCFNGLLYGWNSEFFLLVIKGTPKRNR